MALVFLSIGASLALAGIALIYVPAALIVGGVGFGLFGLLAMYDVND